MSLVICSNNKEEVNLYDRTSLDQAPYRFRNHLTNPIFLPKNSEVAVQSVKLNKDSLIPISPSDIFFQYFGERTDTANEPSSIERTTSFPIMCSPASINIDTKTSYYNISQYVEKLSDAMRIGFPHPDADWAADGTFAQVRRLGGHSGAEFSAFDMNYALLDGSDNGNYDPEDPSTIGLTSDDTNWKFLESAYGDAPQLAVEIDATNNNKMKVLCTADADDDLGNYNYCWINRDPISHLKGVFEIDLTGLIGGGGGITNGWAIGLSRGTDNDFGSVGYFNKDIGSMDDIDEFYDYVVAGVQITTNGEYFLRVGHSVANTLPDADPSDALVLDEIIYYDDGGGSPFSSSTQWRVDGAEGLVQSGTRGYNLSRNWGNFDRLRFIVDGEEIKIELESSSGGAGGNVVADTPYTLTSYTYAIANSGVAINHPKPSGITTWCMVPKIMLEKNGQNVTIDKYDGRRMAYNGTTLNIDNQLGSWYVRQIVNGVGRNALEVDTRYMYIMNSTDNTYVPIAADATQSFYDSYNYVVILGNGEPSYRDTSRANMQSRLGHSRAILSGTIGEASQIYTSDVIPNLMDMTSVFVRLDNFTQKSFNSGTARPSKILYQVPRFDISNRESGTALYYEPHERTYIKLNNSDEIPLNEIHLSLCDNMERLADRGITGKTVIMLHFRESSTPLFRVQI